jgi:hypothetical protein
MKRFTTLIFGLFLSSSALAAECTIDLNYNIQVSSEALSVSDETEEIYNIQQGGLLAVKDESIALNEEQRALAEEYAGEVAALVPRWIALVSEALTVAEESLGVAFTAAFGDDSAAVAKVTEALASARARFEASSSAQDGVYSISVLAFNDEDGAFDEEFNEDLEDAVMASLGSVFAELGKTLIASEGSFNERMESFSRRMKLMGDELDSMGEGLEETAQALCDDVKKAQKLERKLLKEVPELEDYQLFSS